MRVISDLTEGVCLLGRYRGVREVADPVGCWLLHHGKEAAILNLPPARRGGQPPYKRAQEVAEERGVQVRYLFCNHFDGDHFDEETFLGFRRTFPDAVPYAHRLFATAISHPKATFFADEELVSLALDGEPLFLVHAPKHSSSDTFVVFRGTALSGDFEFGTLRSIHDSDAQRVPISVRRKTVDRLLRFAQMYTIHTVVSSRANDVRLNVDFSRIVGETLLDRDLGFGLPVDRIND